MFLKLLLPTKLNPKEIYIFEKSIIMKISLSIVVSFLMLSLQAQVKNETEKRIKKKEVPSEVMNWFKDAYENTKRVKWFYQTDGDKKVYEAKLLHQGKKHSVEILPNGEAVNIEILIDFDSIDPEVKELIENYLTSNYSKFKIKKTQRQYIGSSDDLEDFIDEDELDDDLVINYEIEFYGKNDKENELWEGLFSAEGKLIERRKIKLKATDNLDY